MEPNRPATVLEEDPTVLAASAPSPFGAAAEGLRLSHNFAYTLAGNLTFAGCQWAILIVIAKLGNPTMVGEFALAFAITAPIVLFANQSLRILLATDQSNSSTFRDYLGYRLASILVGLGIICLFLGSTRHPSVVLTVGLSKSFDAISDIIYGLFQAHDRMDRSAVSMIAKGLLSIIIVSTLMVTTRSVVWAAAGMALSSLMILLAYDVPQAARFLAAGRELGSQGLLLRLKPSFQFSTMKRLAALGLPMGVAAFLNSLSTNVPRYMLERYAGTALLGIFAANVYLISAGNTLIAALAQSSVSRLARLHARHQAREFRRLMFKLVAIALGFGLGGILISALWGPIILRVLYRPEYAKWSGVFVLAMISAAFSYLASFGGTALMAVRSIRVQPLLYAACTVVAYGLGIVLIPKGGILGAAWVLVGSSAFQMAASFGILGWARRSHT